MRSAVAVLSVALLAGACGQVSAEPPDTTEEGWELVFRDDFDGTSLDTSKWHTCHWWDVDGCTIISNEELEWYQPEQVIVGDGVLRLRAEPAEIEASNGETYPYVSGMVSTGRSSSDLAEAPRFSFQYGYVEASLAVPDGAGLWPAFWMLPVTNESKPEIDIFEVYADPGVVKMRLHWLDDAGERQRDGEEVEIADLYEGLHTIGLEWTPDRLRWFIDGTEVWRVDENVPQEPMYLVLNLAVGGTAPGPPDDTTPFPAEVVVDWVRVWQRGESP